MIYANDGNPADFLVDDLAGHVTNLTNYPASVRGSSLDAPVVAGGRRALIIDQKYDPIACQLAVYDVVSGARTPLAAVGDCAMVPLAVGPRWAIVARGDRVVDQLWVYDLRDERSFALTSYASGKSLDPSGANLTLDGDRVVWVDDRNGSDDLYFLDLSDYDDGDLCPEGVCP